MGGKNGNKHYSVFEFNFLLIIRRIFLKNNKANILYHKNISHCTFYLK